MVTRREALLTGVGLVLAPAHELLGFGGKDFWNTKEPSDWTDKEVAKILTQSPWAKEAAVEIYAGDMGGEGGPGGAGPPGGPPGGGPGGLPRSKTVVRWESSKPVRLAKKESLGEEPAFYVVSMSGLMLPAGRQRGEEPSDGNHAEQVKQITEESTRLQVKGKDPILPDKVDATDSGESALLVTYYFLKSPPISLEDREVNFISRLGPMEIKVKFLLQDMQYRDQLTL